MIAIYGTEFDIIELNHDLGEHTPYFAVKVNDTFKSTVQEAGYSRGFWLAYSEISFQMHFSTYVAAPNSYDPYGISIDQIPFKDLFATAAVIDVRDKVANDTFYEVTIQDVQNWIEKNGMFPKHCIVIFMTGWDQGRWPDQLAYFGTKIRLPLMRFPGVDLEALKFILLLERKHGIHFVGFGIDTPTLDHGSTYYYPVITLASKHSKYILGNLKDLKRLPPKGAEIMVMPVKLKNGNAAPARVAAHLK
ncbi:UNVERIFIED_CONTAM: hypothetical protein RMT77_011377 [Armadillidium vulgare]